MTRSLCKVTCAVPLRGPAASTTCARDRNLFFTDRSCIGVVQCRAMALRASIGASAKAHTSSMVAAPSCPLRTASSCAVMPRAARQCRNSALPGRSPASWTLSASSSSLSSLTRLTLQDDSKIVDREASRSRMRAFLIFEVGLGWSNSAYTSTEPIHGVSAGNMRLPMEFSQRRLPSKSCTTNLKMTGSRPAPASPLLGSCSLCVVSAVARSVGAKSAT
mmetsp:Transcript_95538/g.246994  ORF Transcript_95538/g.246994 Transcript_95538/m.246994 type:complete len:219 (+) Transcript_95538:387-1043(+)